MAVNLFDKTLVARYQQATYDPMGYLKDLGMIAYGQNSGLISALGGGPIGATDFTRGGTYVQGGPQRPFFGDQGIVDAGTWNGDTNPFNQNMNELYGVGAGIVWGGTSGNSTPWDMFNALYKPDAEGISTNTKRVNLNNDNGNYRFFDYLNERTGRAMDVFKSSVGSSNWIAAQRGENEARAFFFDPNFESEAPGYGTGAFYSNEFDTTPSGFNNQFPEGSGWSGFGTQPAGYQNGVPPASSRMPNGGVYLSSGGGGWHTMNTIVGSYDSQYGVNVQKAAFLPINPISPQGAQGATYTYTGGIDSMPFGVTNDGSWVGSALGYKYQGSDLNPNNLYGPVFGDGNGGLSGGQGIRGLPGTWEAFSRIPERAAQVPYYLAESKIGQQFLRGETTSTFDPQYFAAKERGASAELSYLYDDTIPQWHKQMMPPTPISETSGYDSATNTYYTTYTADIGRGGYNPTQTIREKGPDAEDAVSKANRMMTEVRNMMQYGPNYKTELQQYLRDPVGTTVNSLTKSINDLLYSGMGGLGSSTFEAYAKANNYEVPISSAGQILGKSSITVSGTQGIPQAPKTNYINTSTFGTAISERQPYSQNTAVMVGKDNNTMNRMSFEYNYGERSRPLWY